jgi:hypothetical protein
MTTSPSPSPSPSTSLPPQVQSIQTTLSFMSNPLTNTIDKLYQKTSYLDRYGGSAVIAVFTIIGVFMFFTYSYLKNNSDIIKNNWQKNRCNPLYIPFAGIIIDPKNMTKNEYATNNFFHCFGILLKDVVEAALAPIQAATILITATASVMMQTMNSLMGAILYLRNALSSGFGLLGNRSLNALTLITKLSNVVKNSMSQGQGVFITILYMFISAYGMLTSFFLVVIIAVLVFLAVMLAAAYLAWLLVMSTMATAVIFPWVGLLVPLFVSIAIGMTLTYIVVLIMIIIVIVFTLTVMKKTAV